VRVDLDAVRHARRAVLGVEARFLGGVELCCPVEQHADGLHRLRFLGRHRRTRRHHHSSR
jgi:hypothetical protein